MSQSGQLALQSQLRNVEVAVSESRDSVSGRVSKKHADYGVLGQSDSAPITAPRGSLPAEEERDETGSREKKR